MGNIQALNKSVLSGPVSGYYLTDGKKKIYLFGDEHYSLEQQCSKYSKNIIEYLDDMFLSTDVHIDFFLESNYSDIERKRKDYMMYPEHSILSILINHFKSYGCFLKDNKLCQQTFPMVRFHAADYRFTTECTPMKQVNEIWETIMIAIIILHSRRRKSVVEILDKIHEQLKPVNTFDKIQKTIRKILNCDKLKKQIDKCSPAVQAKIHKYINDKFNYNAKVYKFSYEEIMEKFNEIYENRHEYYFISQIISCLSQIAGILIYVFIIVMDSYMISRIFKNYPDNSEEMMKNIIIYAGDAHIQEYVDFLTKYMGFKIKSIAKSDEKRCLDIKHFKQPLFNKKRTNISNQP